MEDHIDLTGTQPDRDRISTAASAADLVSLLRQAGHPILRDQIRTQPSVCCGGCSG